MPIWLKVRNSIRIFKPPGLRVKGKAYFVKVARRAPDPQAWQMPRSPIQTDTELGKSGKQHMAITGGINKASEFLRDGIWRVSPGTLTRPRAALLQLLRIVSVAVSKFQRHRCPLHASALTFYSLLSIVPVAAMAFAVAKGFGFQHRLETTLIERFPAQQEVFGYVFTFAKALLENTQGGLIAGVSIVVLLWSVIKLLGRIEESFNDIWEIDSSRSLMRRFTDYLSVVLIAPILLIVASSVNVYITTQIVHITEKISLLGTISPLIFFALKLLPYTLIWLMFTLTYLIMPNCKVRVWPALAAGVVAGTIFLITQWAYIHFQIGITRSNAIYGSFAALPLFLVWLQISWLIVLLGAEIAYAIQHIKDYDHFSQTGNVSHYRHQQAAVLISHHLIQRFAKGQPAATARYLAETLKLPPGMTQRAIDDLVEGGLLTATNRANDEPAAYQPAQDPARFTLQFVMEAIDNCGRSDIPMGDGPETRKVSVAMAQLKETLAEQPENRLLKEL
jgi:membrane protein